MKSIIFLCLFALCVKYSQACCFPEKFSMGYTGRVGAKMRVGTRMNIQANVTMNGRMYFNGESGDMFNAASGTVFVRVNGQSQALPVSIEIGMDGGKNLWVKMRMQHPIAGPIERCQYVKFIGGVIPTNEMRCYLNQAVEISRMENGNVVYQKEMAPILTDTVTVNDQCLPVQRVVDVDFAKILQLAGRQSGLPRGTKIDTDIVGTMFDQKVGVDPKLADHKKPRNCMLKRTVRLSGNSNSDSNKLLQAGFIAKRSVHDVKREVSETVNEELNRMAREAVRDGYDMATAGAGAASNVLNGKILAFVIVAAALQKMWRY